MPLQVQRYRARVSGPLLDRIDIQIEVPAVRYRELTERRAGETSAQIRARVEGARHVQLTRRFAGRPIFCNAQMNSRDLRRSCTPAADAERLLEIAMTKLALSARAYTRILKVARTIADLAGADCAPHTSPRRSSIAAWIDPRRSSECSELATRLGTLGTTSPHQRGIGRRRCASPPLAPQREVGML